MNNSNQSAKGTTSINSSVRSTLSGRLKRPSKDLASLGTSSKKPFLKEYSIAMEEKLQTLKEKINEKKKEKTKDQPLLGNKKIVDQKLQKFLKTKSKHEQKNLQQTIQIQLIKQKLHDFLAQNNLLMYQNVLFENQIDSLEILAGILFFYKIDASQKELQEIGIPKGHALKLKVNISKWAQNQFQNEKQKNMRDTKTKDSQRNNSFVSTKKDSTSKNNEISQQQMEKKVESICIGTEEDGMESITFLSTSKPVSMPKSRSKFCLFCYQSIKTQNITQNPDFCSQDCSDRYNQMFKKYQNNLVKAEQEFVKKSNTAQQKQKPQKQIENEQNDEIDEFDLLDENDYEYEDFNYEDYERLKNELSGI